MFVSFCTVTNNPAYLPDVYKSIQKQELDNNSVNWEWVIVLDGIPEPEELRGLPDVHLIHRDESDAEKNNIGALKKKAFGMAQGDLLIDLDHDDILEPGGIMALVNEAVNHKQAFLYGDSAGFKPTGESPVLSSNIWQGYHRTVNGINLRFHTPPVPDPYFLSNYLTIPHQPRAWTSEAYKNLGGFDANLPVAAEHDLICRTYSMGIRMVHVPEARSMYRIRGDAGGAMSIRRAEFNNYSTRNLWKNLRGMVAQWCRHTKLPTAIITAKKNSKIDTASYQWHGTFKIFSDNLETVMESLRGSQLGAIMFSDFLQIIPAGEQIKAVKDMTVDLVDGGWVLGDTPSSTGRGAGDPYGKSLWNEYSFNVLAPEVGLEVIYCNQYHPSPEHKTWDLSFVRADMCKRGP